VTRTQTSLKATFETTLDEMGARRCITINLWWGSIAISTERGGGCCALREDAVRPTWAAYMRSFYTDGLFTLQAMNGHRETVESTIRLVVEMDTPDGGFILRISIPRRDAEERKFTFDLRRKLFNGFRLGDGLSFSERLRQLNPRWQFLKRKATGQASRKCPSLQTTIEGVSPREKLA